MKWSYTLTTETIWTSFDNGEVEAPTREEAEVKAIKEIKEALDNANKAFKSWDVTDGFEINMDFTQIELELVPIQNILLAETEINISGRTCKVSVYRNKNGNIEVVPTEEGIWEEGGWLREGTCTEGYNDEVIISKYIR